MYQGEKFNSISHLIGSVFALIGMGALLTVSIKHQDPWMITSFSVFGGSLILLYTMSTLYHSFSVPKVKKLFQKMDHLSIYLLIAGTYTPYMLVSLREGNGPMMLAAVWVLAITGIILELCFTKRNEKIQVFIYLLMGWLVVFEWSSLKAVISASGLMWLTAGGLAYSLGVIFYILDHKDKLRHGHGIWHLFVLLGSLCHFISIIVYVR
jgi:hemolysin III